LLISIVSSKKNLLLVHNEIFYKQAGIYLSIMPKEIGGVDLQLNFACHLNHMQVTSQIEDPAALPQREGRAGGTQSLSGYCGKERILELVKIETDSSTT
jgi:hypothetical protein